MGFAPEANGYCHASARAGPDRRVLQEHITRWQRSVKVSKTTLQLHCLESLHQTALRAMPFAKLRGSLLERRLRSRSLGEIAQVHQKRDGLVVALGQLGVDQFFDLTPGLSFLRGQLVEILASSLGLLLFTLRLFLRPSLGGFSSFLLDFGVTCRQELRDRAPAGCRPGPWLRVESTRGTAARARHVRGGHPLRTGSGAGRRPWRRWEAS